jgi:hypothetical protein
MAPAFCRASEPNPLVHITSPSPLDADRLAAKTLLAEPVRSSRDDRTVVNIAPFVSSA